MTALTISPMLPYHLNQVAAIEQQTQLSPWPVAEFERSLDNPKRFARVAHSGQELVGYAVFSLVGTEAELLTISISPLQQGKGLGKNLLQQGLGQLQFESVFLEVRASNQAAIALYEGLGFNAVGERKNYYPKGTGKEDAIIYAYTHF